MIVPESESAKMLGSYRHPSGDKEVGGKRGGQRWRDDADGSRDEIKARSA